MLCATASMSSGWSYHHCVICLIQSCATSHTSLRRIDSDLVEAAVGRHRQRTDCGARRELGEQSARRELGEQSRIHAIQLPSVPAVLRLATVAAQQAHDRFVQGASSGKRWGGKKPEPEIITLPFGGAVSVQADQGASFGVQQLSEASASCSRFDLAKLADKRKLLEKRGHH